MIKKVRVTVEGKVYELEVELLDDQGNPLPEIPGVLSPAVSSTPMPAAAPLAAAPAAAAASPAKSAGPAGPGDIVSPLAGRVVEVACKEGDEVKEGDQLLTLEAMKMNTFIYAQKAGKVSKVHIEAGASVEEGQALVTVS